MDSHEFNSHRSPLPLRRGRGAPSPPPTSPPPPLPGPQGADTQDPLVRPRTPENRLSVISEVNTTPDSRILFEDGEFEITPTPIQYTRVRARRVPPFTASPRKRASAAISRGVSELAAVFEPARAASASVLSTPEEHSSSSPPVRTLRVTNLSRSDIQQQALDGSSSPAATSSPDPFTAFDQQSFDAGYRSSRSASSLDDNSLTAVDDQADQDAEEEDLYHATPPQNCMSLLTNQPDNHISIYSTQLHNPSYIHSEASNEVAGPIVIRPSRPEFATHFITPTRQPAPRPSLIIRQGRRTAHHTEQQHLAPQVNLPTESYDDRRSIVREWADGLQEQGTPGFEQGAAGLSDSTSTSRVVWTLSDNLSSSEASRLRLQLERPSQIARPTKSQENFLRDLAERMSKVCMLCQHADGELADNPYCCADPTEKKQRACVECWDAFFLKALEEEGPAAWFRCASCQRTLLSHDKSRLVSKGTMLVHAKKIVQHKFSTMARKVVRRKKPSTATIGRSFSALSGVSAFSGATLLTGRGSLGESVRSRGAVMRGGGLSARDRKHRAKWPDADVRSASIATRDLSL